MLVHKIVTIILHILKCYKCFSTGVSNPAHGGPLSCRVEHTPEAANQGLTRHTRNLKEGVFRKVGAKLCSGPPGPSFDTTVLVYIETNINF